MFFLVHIGDGVTRASTATGIPVAAMVKSTLIKTVRQRIYKETNVGETPVAEKYHLKTASSTPLLIT